MNSEQCRECPATLFCETGNTLTVLKCVECKRTHDIGVFDMRYRTLDFGNISSYKLLIQALFDCSAYPGILFMGGHCPECFSGLAGVRGGP
jgi:hypothetical protein